MPNRKIKHIVAKLVGASTEETLDVYDVDAVHTADIANNLTTTNEGYVLDARQGKALNDSLTTTFSKRFIYTTVGAEVARTIERPDGVHSAIVFLYRSANGNYEVLAIDDSETAKVTFTKNGTNVSVGLSQYSLAIHNYNASLIYCTVIFA